MSASQNGKPNRELAVIIEQAVAKYNTYIEKGRQRWLLVDVAGQRLALIQDRTPLQIWPVSTAAVGLDNSQDSGGTPAGAHCIDEKIGAGCPVGAIFESRQFTNRVHRLDTDCAPAEDLILTRILTVVGCEPGHNLGPGVDSRERFIYLHGTPDEARIGQPVSHGCVRLTNQDILTVFDLVSEGDPVVII